MLKHTDLTRRRIAAFISSELKPRIYADRAPLKIEINENSCECQPQAEAGPWKEVGPGYEYGPAYTVFWFRLSGAIPESFLGKHVAVVAEVGGERTVWKDGSPWRGVDVEHSDFGWLEGSAMGGSATHHGPNEVKFYVQAYTRNSETTVHGKEAPRKSKTEKVEKAELVVVDTELKDLYYDLEFTVGLLDTIEQADPAHQTILRALNDVVNTFSP